MAIQKPLLPQSRHTVATAVTVLLRALELPVGKLKLPDKTQEPKLAKEALLDIHLGPTVTRGFSLKLVLSAQTKIQTV